MKYTTTSAGETLALAKKVADSLKGGEVIALSGDLGAGKTTFAKGLARALKIKKPVTSPTFVLMKIYPTKGKIKKLVHIDCYRLTGPQDIEAIGAPEYFNQSDTITVIEWPEKVKAALPKKTIVIKFKIEKNINKRIIIIQKYGKNKRD